MRRENCNICLMKKLRNILDGCSSYKAVMDDLIKEINNETENDLSKMLSLRAEINAKSTRDSQSNLTAICALFFSLVSFASSFLENIIKHSSESECVINENIWRWGWFIPCVVCFILGFKMLMDCIKSINMNNHHCYMLEAVNECIRRNIEEKK
ncbi:MAG: hypothetical protein K6G84_03000 [Lachnospiraceae bacterium]|nr:hypothetical protein [Lachnospiraceae bacterium]